MNAIIAYSIIIIVTGLCCFGIYGFFKMLSFREMAMNEFNKSLYGKHLKK